MPWWAVLSSGPEQQLRLRLLAPAPAPTPAPFRLRGPPRLRTGELTSGGVTAVTGPEQPKCRLRSDSRAGLGFGGRDLVGRDLVACSRFWGRDRVATAVVRGASPFWKSSFVRATNRHGRDHRQICRSPLVLPVGHAEWRKHPGANSLPTQPLLNQGMRLHESIGGHGSHEF